MNMFKAWQVHGDGGERGTGPIIGYASTKSRADEMAKGQGWYGGTGWVQETSVVEIEGKIYALASPVPIDLDGVQAGKDAILRKQTLANMSDDQLRVLGLKREK